MEGVWKEGSCVGDQAEYALGVPPPPPEIRYRFIRQSGQGLVLAPLCCGMYSRGKMLHGIDSSIDHPQE